MLRRNSNLNRIVGSWEKCKRFSGSIYIWSRYTVHHYFPIDNGLNGWTVAKIFKDTQNYLLIIRIYSFHADFLQPHIWAHISFHDGNLTTHGIELVEVNSRSYDCNDQT